MTSLGRERARGAAWRIWDLHVHTPASIVHGYGGSDDATWERFIDELEKLPSDMSVIGINDYWFLDGYRRVRAAKESGRLKNLEEIFPVIEMRLDQFGGSTSKLSRVNLHVVFDPSLGPDLIQAQFISALQSKVQLRPGHATPWQGVITRESLADYGREIKSSVPKSELGNYGSDLSEGFNNLNVSLTDVQALLEGRYFKGKSLVGVGKTEWADLKWSKQSIGAKKNVINAADFIFTAYEDSARWVGDVAKLSTSQVNARLLDCSDAHHFADSGQHMRLGACQTWVNTTPTLAGLAYALEEFHRRVYVGLEPPMLSRIRRSPERFISSISVKSLAPEKTLFDYSLPINAGFVAVVGNKGQGKSALLDCIALAGNSSRNREFAFLSPGRFLNPSSRKLAREYATEIEWATGGTRRVLLDAPHDRSAPVSIEYLPQAFVERVCNAAPDAGDADEFEDELREILFTHIGESERAGEKSFDGLLGQKVRASLDAIERLRDDLRETASAYASTAAFRAANELASIENKLHLKQSEVASAEAALEADRDALASIDAASLDDGRLTTLKSRAIELDAERERLLGQIQSNEHVQAVARQSLVEMATLFQRIEAMKRDAESINSAAAMHLPEADIPVLSIQVNELAYHSWRETEGKRIADEHDALDVLRDGLASLEVLRHENADSLAAADSARERARQRVLQSVDRVSALTGGPDDADSLEGLQALRQRVNDAPAESKRLRERLVELSREIHAAIEEQLTAVTGLYEPATRFIARSEVVQNAGLDFNAELRILPSWNGVSSGLDGRRNGDLPDWLGELPTRVEDTSWAQLGPELEQVISRLERERGESEGAERDPNTALRNATTLEDFLVELLDLAWLEVRFGLTGDGLPLSQLSPGQRGLVLALFYLVIDRRTTPLLLDQPEENLDNATIAAKLVPAIHEAAGRRQTIVVTHNANLAVVGDADQIVHCRLVDQKFTVSSGSISELSVAQFALDVLEGTKSAFDNRQHKYAAFPDIA